MSCQAICSRNCTKKTIGFIEHLVNDRHSKVRPCTGLRLDMVKMHSKPWFGADAWKIVEVSKHWRSTKNTTTNPPRKSLPKGPLRAGLSSSGCLWPRLNSGGTEIQNLKINSFLPGELHRGKKKKQDEDFMRSALQIAVNWNCRVPSIHAVWCIQTCREGQRYQLSDSGLCNKSAEGGATTGCSWTFTSPAWRNCLRSKKSFITVWKFQSDILGGECHNTMILLRHEH